MASAAVELNQQRSDLSLASKPARSHAQTIDSIPHQDSASAHQKKKEATINCNHFSIRGYVVELRKRNPKLCDPFSPYPLHEGSLDSNHELPPMVVPKFRWWKCDGCVPTSDSPTRAVKLAHSSPEDKSACLAKHVTVKASNVEAPGDENAELACTSDSNKNQNCSPSLMGADDQKGKGKGKAHVEEELITHLTGCKENAMVGFHQKNGISDGIETRALEDFMDHENGKAHSVSLPDLNVGNKAHSDDGAQNEVLVFGNGSVFEEEDDCFGVDSRKAPKVRLLSELLGSKENPNGAQLKKVESGDGEVSESESEDESTEIVSEAVVKKHGKSTTDERPLPEKRNNKKIKIDHGDPSLMSQMKITPKSSNEKGKSSETNHVSTDANRDKPCQDVRSDRVTDLPRKSVVADLDEKRLGLARRKGKIIQIAKERISSREGTAFRKDNDILQKGTEHVQNGQSPDASQIHRLPDSYMRMGNDQLHVTQGGNGFYLPPSSTEPLIINYSGVKKHVSNNSIRETSLGFGTSHGVSVTQSQFEGARDRSTVLKTNLKVKQVQIPQAEEGSPPINQNVTQVASSVTNQKELTRRIQNIDINSIPTDEKVPEQGKGDDSHDIPMDIVELMAKNQYERNLVDPRDKQHCVSIAENVRSNESTSACGEQMLKLNQPCFLSWQNTIPKYARSSVPNGFEATDSLNAKLLMPFSEFNQSHLSFRGHISKYQVPTKSLTFSRGQDPYSALNLTANNWTRYTEAQQRCPPSFLQTMGSYNTSYTASSPRTNVEAHIWPSVVGGNKGKIHHEGPSILSFGQVNLEKQIDFSSTYNGGNKQKGANSVDLYSNEVIPAMHLLSLMQNGGKSDLPKRGPNVTDHEQYKEQHHNSQESRHPLLESNGRTSNMQDSSFHPCYPMLPPVCSFTTSLQGDGIGRKTGFQTPIPLTSLGQRNIESSHFAPLRPQKVGSCNPGRKRKVDSTLYKGKGTSGVRYLPFSTNAFQDTKDSANYPYGLARTCDKKTFCPIPQKDICMLNQNPSEFNDLKELRRYMIRPEDLRPREIRREKSVQRGNTKRQEMRMNKPMPCLMRKITTEVSSM